MIRIYFKKKKNSNRLTRTDAIWKPDPLRGGTPTEIDAVLTRFLFVWPHVNPWWHIHRLLADARHRLPLQHSSLWFPFLVSPLYFSTPSRVTLNNTLVTL